MVEYITVEYVTVEYITVEQTHATAGLPLSSTLSAGVAKGYTVTSYPLNAVSQKHREYLTGMP